MLEQSTPTNYNSAKTVKYAHLNLLCIIWIALTFIALEGFKDVDERLCGQLFVVLGGNLHTHLQVLPDVRLQHGLQALQRVFH